MPFEVFITDDLQISFQIGSQSFRVAYQPETPEEAEWYADQLTIALNNLKGEEK